MTEIKPQFLDEESYAAKFDRQFPRDILTEGIVATGDLEITELDTPAMGVKVAAGSGYVQGDQTTTQGHYRIYNDASKNLSIAASDPTNPRKDRIIAQVYDSIDIGGVDDKWVLEVLTGTPAASPVAPALPDDALDLAIVDVGAGVTTIVNANITDQRSQIGLTIIGAGDGWIASGETWTYASADAPTYTITVPTNATTKYSAGMKIKLTHGGSVKYFIITKVAATVLTLYGGTDYTLADTAITLPYYSTMKAPLGFPLGPAKWTIILTDAENRTQSNPAVDTWYNLGALSLTIPIGSWSVSYHAAGNPAASSAVTIVQFITLSTANNSESDTDLTLISSVGSVVTFCITNSKEKFITLASKTIYYLNAKRGATALTSIGFNGALAKTIIRAVCAYL